ncbi:Pre-mRNA-splicing factor CWC25-like protein [Bienertia sinuspersici]
MALKFLNKKGWHTGSLRNIENVWKAEQKHEAEQRKLEELRKQIHEERERDEFRLLQEQAGLTPRQERLEFLYDSGLAVGKPSSEGFKALETPTTTANNSSASASAAADSSSTQSAAPGALFEDKPQSANDAWRKLHTDPLLMIRQREQEALARIKNNPVKMAMIRKSVESKHKPEESHDGERQKVKSKHKKHSSSKHQSDSDNESHEERERKRKVKHRRKDHHSDTESDVSEDRERKRKVKNKRKVHLDSDEDSRDRNRYRSHSHRDSESEKQHRSNYVKQKSDRNKDRERTQRGYEKSKHEEYHSEHRNEKSVQRAIDSDRSNQASDSKHAALPPRQDSYRRRGKAPQLSEEERAAKLREMQMDAEVHEEQRWKRLKKADEDDAREASQLGSSRGRSFLHSVQKSVFGAEKGGGSTIEESVRRRAHYLQGRTADEGNAFRR